MKKYLTKILLIGMFALPLLVVGTFTIYHYCHCASCNSAEQEAERRLEEAQERLNNSAEELKESTEKLENAESNLRNAVGNEEKANEILENIN